MAGRDAPRFYVEPSPSGGWRVMLAGHDAPVSRHDTEEEAIARRDAYARGVAFRGEPNPDDP